MAYLRIHDLWYCDPTFQGEAWVITCDDTDGLLLRVKSRAKTPKAARELGSRVLKQLGITASIAQASSCYKSKDIFKMQLHDSWHLPLLLRSSVSLEPTTYVGKAREPLASAKRYPS